MTRHNALTPDEARAALANAGISIAAWAKAKGFSRSTVAAVLRGDRIPRIGQSHRIAVALGMKSGVTVDDPKKL